MSTEQNKSIARRFSEAFDSNDQATFNELLAPDLVAHVPGAPGPLNREAFLQLGNMFIAAFSDSHITLEDQIAEGDKVVSRYTWRMVHTGAFQGLPPTSK